MDKFNLELLSNPFKMNKNQDNDNTESQQIKRKFDISIPHYKSDDNDEIMKLLHARLDLGRNRYGHGVIVDDDTRKYGTQDNDWELMALEEMLDGLIYTTASIIRYRREKTRKQREYNNREINDDIIVDYGGREDKNHVRLIH